jgi:hypothetical protein
MAREIEQFLGRIERDNRCGLRSISLGPGRDRHHRIRVRDLEDISADEFLDISALPCIDPDEERWGKEIATVASPDEALRLAGSEFGAGPRPVGQQRLYPRGVPRLLDS